MVWGALFVLVADRVIKQIAVTSNAFGAGVVNPDHFLFISGDYTRMLLISIIALCTAIAVALSYGKSLEHSARRYYMSPFILVLGGGASNVIDRLAYGGVIDMFVIPGFTVFNIADLALITGSAWCMYLVWRQQSIQVH